MPRGSGDRLLLKSLYVVQAGQLVVQRGIFRFLQQLLLRQFGRFLIAAQLFQLFDCQRRGHVMASEKWGFFYPWHATTEELILQEI